MREVHFSYHNNFPLCLPGSIKIKIIQNQSSEEKGLKVLALQFVTPSALFYYYEYFVKM